MAKKLYVHLDGQNIVELQNCKLNPVAADPTAPIIGSPWFNTTTGRLKVYDGTEVEVQVLATLGDLTPDPPVLPGGLITGRVDINNGTEANIITNVVPAFLAGGKIFSYMIILNGVDDITSELSVKINQNIPKISFVPTVDTGFLYVYFIGTAA